ncbi:28S ribosomal protein S31, mitochondrial [Sitophilus oryzae]|uniref:Small ribosomal subunit protein mS31 n=1 Tax=Sitophilus oryzae TaxID=7048 RepID=A0A6J2YS26_SITOR|nr:28S ribosomal protein S31, mitochondrial [Sitophilus oryzae]
MNITQVILRKLPSSQSTFLRINLTCSKTIFCQKSTNNPPSSSSSSSSESSSDSDEIAQKKKASKEQMAEKLNNLLQQMVSDDYTKRLDLAKPSNKRIKSRKPEEKVESEEKQVLNAVKDVAQSIEGDSKKIESELLTKLLNPLDSERSATTLSDIIKGMKIEREVKQPEVNRAEQVRRVLQNISTQTQVPQKDHRVAPREKFRPRPVEDVVFEKIDLFGSESLGIFNDNSKLEDGPQLKTWSELAKKDLKLAVTHPPANYFQEMILWTEQGKIWKFPINNEIGLDEEAKVYFADHVFLEEHLEPWCPPKGPIRHFMELVCTGLSKNPYITVETKKEHIYWYRDYFGDKETLLRDVGAIPQDFSMGTSNVVDKE